MKIIDDYLNLEYLGENKASILTAVCLGLISLVALRKYFCKPALDNKKYKYPAEIDFNDKQIQQSLGSNLGEFLANLSKRPEECLMSLQKLYPTECSLTLNTDKVIFLNSIGSFKKFNQKTTTEPIASRPKNVIFKLISKNYLGSFFRLYDEKLKEIRKSSLTGLHKLSANAAEFDAKLSNEIEDFIEFLNTKCVSSSDQTSGRLDSAVVHLQQISTNMIVSVGLGARFPYEIDRSAAVKEQINNISDILSAADIVNISNLNDASAFKPFESKLNSVYDFLTGAINGYKANYEKDVIQTFADYVLSKQAEHEKLDPEDVYSDRDILVQFFTLLMAGAVSTGFTLSWAIYYLASDPKVQAKMYDEINEVVGTGSFIGTKHRASLKYTEAVVNEALRLSSTQPLIGRATFEASTNIDNTYTLPANTPVFVNEYAIHRDPTYWSANADTFNPDRWLSIKETAAPSFIPFGAGPRSCIGDTLSRLILFLTVVNLVQRFEFSVEKADLSQAKTGYMRKPPNYNLVFNVRK